MQFNIEVPTHILRQVANPGQNRNCYDSKIIEHFDPDDFKEYVDDNLGPDSSIVEGDKYGLTDHIFPAGFNPIEYLQEGSGCNGNAHFNEYGTWRAALYDIWEDVMAYSGSQPN